MTPNVVLVPGQDRNPHGVYHLPDEAGSLTPRCYQGDRHYWEANPDRLPSDYRLCRYCDPDFEIDRRTPDHQLRDKLLAMDPDEVTA